MFIQTEATPNPNTIKFIPGVPVMTSGVAEFLSRDEAVRDSSLAEQLFAIDGVQSVFFGADFVAVTKTATVDWTDIKTYALGALFEHFTLGKPLLNTPIVDEISEAEEDNEITRKIRELLDTRVRPAVAKDGGDIVFHRFDKGILYLKMRGACSGCPSSTMTLKMGIENMMRHYIPDVLEVRAIED